MSHDPFDALLRRTTVEISRRTAAEGGPLAALRPVLELIDNDEAEMALDELVHMIGWFRIRLLPAEHDRLAVVAAHWNAVESLPDRAPPPRRSPQPSPRRNRKSAPAAQEPEHPDERGGSAP
ncbi:hypothetical protein [Streptomyces sp. P9-A2]|uniref:hypothetical protein n=1 Tax=Streptomyces sp. P9-A2 TaxID=3072284 RepID=UPI002FC9FF9D